MCRDPQKSLETIFGEAIELASPEARAAFLDEACGNDRKLRQEVEKLVADYNRAGDFLERPAAALPDVTLGFPEIRESPGAVIGPYQLLEQIGEGGFGVVFMAEQQQPMRRKVALKILKLGMDTREVIARFEAERQALALMDHPNIAKVLDAGGTESGRPYFVMELVKGTPITAYCDERRLALRDRLELFVSVCQAVQHAHQKGIIHRDLKPTNVLVALYDGRPAPKVIDFGVAKATGPKLTERTLLTGFGSVVGTLEYMSPEQAELNQLDIDTRSDIYSLGVLLYELLTGTTPLERSRLKATGLVEALRIIREEEASTLSQRLTTAKDLPAIAGRRGLDPPRLRKLVRGELNWIVMKALEKDRNRRYESANALALDVQRYLRDEPVLACPPSASYRLQKFVRRHKGPVLAAVLVLATLLAGVVGTTTALIEAQRQRDDAYAQRRKAYQAVDDYFVRVSENTLLNEPALEPLRKQLLQDALRYYQEFVEEHGDDPALRAELVATYLRITTLTFQMGPEEDWLLPFQNAIATLEDLLKTSPDPAALESLKTPINYSNATPMFYVRDPDAALRAFERARALWEELVRGDPQAPGFRSTLAIIHQAIAVLNEYTTRPADEAVRSLESAVALWRGLAEEDPSNPGYRAALAISLRSLGVRLAATGDFARAEQAHQDALRTARRLAADFPDAPGPQEILHCDIPGGVGLAHEAAGQWDKAVAAYCQKVAGYERLIEQYPTVARYQAGLFWARHSLGPALWARGDREEAVEEFRQMKLLGEQLSKDDRDVEQMLGWLLATCPERELRDAPRALELGRQAVERMPQYGFSWTVLGAARYENGDHRTAADALEKGVRLPNFWGSTACFFLAMAKAHLGEKDEARRWYDQGVIRLERHEVRCAETLRIYDEARKMLGFESKPQD